MFNRSRFFNIKMAAEDGGAGGATPPAAPETPPEAPEVPGAPQSLQDLLASNPALKAEMDEAIKKRLEEQDAKFKGELAAQQTAAERLKNLEGEERRAEEERIRIEALAERERKVELRELRNEAASILAERKLPASLIDSVDFNSAETVQASITALGEAFTAAVGDRVKEITKGTVQPGSGATPPATSTVDKDVARWRKKLNLDQQS